MQVIKKVLLVEDDLDDQEFFTDAINVIPNVELFAISCNGQEALNTLLITLVLPDLIFMDINMPVMNGVQCLVEIGKTARIKHIPVIIISANTQMKEYVCKLGAKAFINKAEDSENFAHQIEEMINFDFINSSIVPNQLQKAANCK